MLVQNGRMISDAHFISKYVPRSSLTGGEATSKEHVEEVFRSDVGLKAPVEVKASSVRVTRAARLLSSCQVILPSFVCVAQHCICVTDLCRKTRLMYLREKKASYTNHSLDVKIQSLDTPRLHYPQYLLHAS